MKKLCKICLKFKHPYKKGNSGFKICKCINHPIQKIMKTIEEIKNEVAVKYGFENWAVMYLKDIWKYADEVAEQYAKQRCDEQINSISVFLVDKGHVKAVIDLMKFT